MRINFSTTCRAALVAGALCFSSNLNADADAERMARLEARLAELEARLADQEQATKEVKVLASNTGNRDSSENGSIIGDEATLDILSSSAWRNLRWTQEEQWEGVRRGVSEETVVELLGSPPRSVKSLKPRVDEVYFYETSLRDRSNALRGKVSFKNGKVISVEKPNFQAVKQARQAR